MRLFTIILIALFLISCGKGAEPTIQGKVIEDKGSETQSRKELDEIKKSLRGDTKIKLKKDGKGSYSWEITGKDVQEVLKANEALRKKLNE